MPTEPALSLEIVETEKLAGIAKENALAPATAESLQASFAPFFQRARSTLEQSRQIVVTDASDTLKMKLAKECRKALKEIRLASDKMRADLKQESLRKGRAIDGFHNILLEITEAEEKRLREQEEFIERQEAARRAAVKAERETALAPYGIDTSCYMLDVMTPDTFDNLLATTKLAHQQKIDAAAKLEAERIAKEKADADERERVRLENERLKAEAEEREAALAAERQKAEDARIAAEKEAARLKAEAEARELAAHAKAQRLFEEAEAKAKAERDAIEAKAKDDREAAEAKAAVERLLIEKKAAAEKAEIQRKADAEAKAAADAAKKLKDEADKRAADERAARERAERELAEKLAAEKHAQEQAEEAQRRAAAAPDREKLVALSSQIREIKVPQLTTPEGIAMKELVEKQIDRLALWISDKAANL